MRSEELAGDRNMGGGVRIKGDGDAVRLLTGKKRGVNSGHPEPVGCHTPARLKPTASLLGRS